MKLPGLSSLVPLAFAVWDRVRPPSRDATDDEVERWAGNAALVTSLAVLRGTFDGDPGMRRIHAAWLSGFRTRAAAARARVDLGHELQAWVIAKPMLLEACMQRLEASQRALGAELKAHRP